MESFIEINEELVIHFEDWIYDAILNRTIKELEEDNLVDFAEFLKMGKRGANEYLSLLFLEVDSYKLLFRYFRRALSKSQQKRTGVYSKKAHNTFIIEFKDLIFLLYKDERFQS